MENRPSQPLETDRRRRSIWSWILALLTAVSFIGAIGLTGLLDRKLPAMTTLDWPTVTAGPTFSGDDRIQAWGYLPPGHAGNSMGTGMAKGILLLFADHASIRMSDRMLAAALSDIGVGTVIVRTSRISIQPGDLEHILAKVRDFSGREATNITIAAWGGASAGLVQALSDVKTDGSPEGLILISPDGQDTRLAGLVSRFPPDRQLTILVSDDRRESDAGRQLFFLASGEDATLFPGISGTGSLSPEQFISVDGQRRLIILPAFSLFNEGWSPRLHRVIQDALPTGVSNPAAAGLTRTLYDRLLLPLGILILLVATPLLFILQRSISMTATPSANRLKRPVGWMRLVPASLLSGAAAVPIGRLLAGLADDARLASGYAFYAMIGIFGWFFLILATAHRPARATEQHRSGHSIRATLMTVALALLYLTAVLFWIRTIFANVLPRGDHSLAVLVVALLLTPAMLPATMPLRQVSMRQELLVTWLHVAMPTGLFSALTVWTGCASIADVLFALVMLIAGRVMAKALSFLSAPPIISSVAGSLLMLLIWP